MNTTIEKLLSDESKFIEKKRTRALATGNWTLVIMCDAKLELCSDLKDKALAIALKEIEVKP